jgi:hypothetical protein
MSIVTNNCQYKVVINLPDAANNSALKDTANFSRTMAKQANTTQCNQLGKNISQHTIT